MPFECQVCLTEKKIADANVCHQCDNIVCKSCWISWCYTDTHCNKSWQDVPCPFCRTTHTEAWEDDWWNHPDAVWLSGDSSSDESQE